MPVKTVDDDPEQARRFREGGAPYLDDVYTLARYLLREGSDAEDAVQECYLRALKHFDRLSRPGDEAVAVRDPAQCLQRRICQTRGRAEHRPRGHAGGVAEQTPMWQEASRPRKPR